ncbi:MAG: ABC transporter substrate-binding protein [Burkholderiales bacterium]
MRARRKILAAVGASLLCSPLLALAQRDKIWRVGFIVSATSPQVFTASGRTEAFLQGMRELGYAEGRNLVVDWRYAEGKYERLIEIATDLVQLKVDVIVATASPAIRAAQKATSTIPIVMVATADPLGSGFVASLARPGGNTTGLSSGSTIVSAKHIELLMTAVPRLSNVGVLGDPGSSSLPAILEELRSAAKKLGLKLVRADVKTPQEIEAAFGVMKRERVDGLIVVQAPLTVANRRQITELAAKLQIPAIYGTRDYTETGGLMSYGTNLLENYRRAAAYVDKIFKGAKPGDLPVEQPTKFELVINLKAAKALGLTIPPDLLLRAEELIR